MNKAVDTDQPRDDHRILRMMSECNQMIARATAEAQLLDDLCRIAIEFGGYRLSWVGKAEADEAKSVRPIAQAGYEAGYLQAANITWADTERGRGPAGTALRTRQPVIMRHIAADPQMAPWREAALQRGYQSVIGLPLLIQNELFGVWMIYSSEPDAFDEAEVTLLSELVRDIVFGITALRVRAENRRAEEALRQSEATLRGVFWAAPVGIGILKDRVIERANKHWCEMHACAEADLIGQNARVFYESDEEFERVGRELYDRLWQRGIAAVETRHRRGDTFLEVSLTAAPIRPDDPSAGVVVITQDITDRKRDEQKLEDDRKHLEEMVRTRTAELQAANDQLEAIFQSANVGIVVLRDRIIQQCNSRLEEIFGYASGELAGQPTRLWYGDDAGYAVGKKVIDERIRFGQIDRREQQLRRKDGSLFWARMTGRSLDLANPDKGMVGVIEDITAEREAAESLRIAAAEQQAIFDSATSGIVLVKDRVIVRCNHKMDELFGYAPGEMLGHTTHNWYPDEATFQAIGKETAACLANGTTFRREQELVRKDGSRFWGRMTAQAADKGAPAKGLVGIIDDITAEREHSESLKQALQRAEESDRLKSAFLATMSHELRTPLNSIIGFTGILLQKLAGPLNDEQAKQLGMVQSSSRQLLALINDVLDISKIEAGQMRVNVEPFDLCESITRVAETVRPHAERRGLALRVEIAPDAGELTSDQRRFEQILLNLLNNSVKFTEKGAITLTAAVAAGTLRIEVADTGIGIKAEDLCHLFQPFRQIESGLTRQHEGTGLGLAICRRLTELLGGEIHVSSEWGKGSVFALTLPAKGRAAP